MTIIEGDILAIIVLGKGTPHLLLSHLQFIYEDGLNGGLFLSRGFNGPLQLSFSNNVVFDQVVKFCPLFSGLREFLLIVKGNPQDLCHLNRRLLIFLGESVPIFLVNELEDPYHILFVKNGDAQNLPCQVTG